VGSFRRSVREGERKQQSTKVRTESSLRSSSLATPATIPRIPCNKQGPLLPRTPNRINPPRGVAASAANRDQPAPASNRSSRHRNTPRTSSLYHKQTPTDTHFSPNQTSHHGQEAVRQEVRRHLLRSCSASLRPRTKARSASSCARTAGPAMSRASPTITQTLIPPPHPPPPGPSAGVGVTSAGEGVTSAGGGRKAVGGGGEYDPKEFLRELLASGRFTLGGPAQQGESPSPLPETVRREILELGLPDHGYDYTKHLRVIGQPGTGASSAQTYSLGAFIPAPAPRSAAPDVKVRFSSLGP